MYIFNYDTKSPKIFFGGTMVHDSIEFVVDYMSDVFDCVKDKSDRRIIAIKRFCNTLKKSREKRCGSGTVLVTLKIYDHLKYANPATESFLKNIDSGRIQIFKEDSDVSAGDIMIMSFNGKDDKPSAWSSSINNFFIKMTEHVSEHFEKPANSNRYYLQHYPKEILDSENTQFFIFCVVTNVDDGGYDLADISIVGFPKEREEEIHEIAITKMFAYH